MNGGGICNNTTTGNGGGVSNFGVFIMNGGEIVGNKAADAGGVYNYGNTFSISGPGSFTMNGGKINQNTGKWGGGIQSSGSLTVNGEVSDNTAWFGGGIHSEDKGQVVSGVVIQNSAKIKNNSAFNDSDGGPAAESIFKMALCRFRAEAFLTTLPVTEAGFTPGAPMNIWHKAKPHR